jgi:hypothetical protein
MRCTPSTPTVRRFTSIGSAMNATVSCGSRSRVTARARKRGSASMSCTIIGWPVASTAPVMPSPAA